MTSYNFRLQRLLGFRNMEEEEAKRELGQRRMALEKETARLSGLKKEEEQILEQWRKQTQDNIELPLLQATQEYSDLLENRVLNQIEQYRKSQYKVEEQREVTKESWRRKRMLEILESKARIEHYRQEQITERNFIDEVVLNAYYRKGGD